MWQIQNIITEVTDDINPADMPEQNTLVAREISTTDYKFAEHKIESIGVGKDRENQENTVRVPSKQLEQINDLFGELIIQRNGLNSQIEKLRKLVRHLSQRVQTS